MQPKSDRGFTLIELLIVVAIIGILAGICAHHVMRARAAANDASAIGTMRTISSGQTAFAATCGAGAYSISLTQLATDHFISDDAQLPNKSGFTITLTPGPSQGLDDCAARETRTTFYAKAEPMAAGLGNRAFATNQLGTVWQDTTMVAPVEPFTQTGTVSPIQ